jgi:hypothetical protein
MGPKESSPMVRPALMMLLALGVVGCTPTINVKVEPISIYAKLDADVRIKLDREVEAAIKQNPDLF